MQMANFFSRYTVVIFFAAAILAGVLVLTPGASGQVERESGESRPATSGIGAEPFTIGTRRHELYRRADDAILGQAKYDSLAILDGNLVQSPTAPTVSNGVVISQVYAGGGVSASSLFSHDFIELFNRGTSPVNVNGWSVQWVAATGSTWTQITALPNVTLQPGQYLLIQQATGGAGGDPLPTADVAGTIPMDTSSGKVALTNNTNTLIGACPTGGAIVDFVGYGGGANCFEGVLPTSAPSVTNSAKRQSGGCVDNDQNRYDFAISAATPRNTASSTNVCVGPTTGGRIAFTSNRSGVNAMDTDVFVMNADGSSQTRLTNNSSPEQFPSFSPDGTKIVFTRADKIFVMNVDGSSQTELTATAGNFEPKFSPNASKIVFSSTRDGNQEIYTMNADGTGAARITNNTATDRYPAFSPDGTKIAFTSDRDGQNEIYIMNVDGTNQVRLTNVVDRDSSAPTFSPDGTRIAFESYRTGNISNIYTMNVDGSNVVRLTTTPDDFAASFSPDGSAIAFYTTRHGGDNLEVYTMNVDGSNQRNISSTLGPDLEPSWGIVAGALVVTNVDSSGGSGTFGVGAVIPIQVTFGAPVTVTGTPTLRLATGGAGFPVNYSSGSGTAILTFNYTVQPGHSSADLDYLSTSSLVLNGGTINSFGGTPANLTLPAPGGAGSLGLNRNIVIDTVAPDTSILTGPTGTVASTSAAFTFNSTEGGTFQCRLDGAAFSACTSGISYNSLSQGAHTFEVRAVDTALNQDPTPASRTWTVDTVAPQTTIDSGPSGPTSSNSAVFSFSSSEAGSTFQCSLNGGGFSSCTSPATYNGLTEGAKTFEVRATDPAGNQDATPASRNWTVDTIAPDTTIDSGPTGTVNSTLAQFSFSSNEGSATFQCRLDGAAYAPCISPVNYGGLSQGQHTFDVRAVDAANNTDATPASRTWTADSIAPETTINSGPTGSLANTSATFNFSSNEVSSSFQCQIDGGGFSSCTSPVSYNSLSQGPHNFQVRAIDLAGNTDATPAVRSWTVDTIAPDTTIDSGPSGFVSSTSATFNFSSNEVGVTFLCSINGGLYSPCVSGVTYNGLAEGERNFGVRAIDAAGNQDGSPALRTWTIDTTAPDTTIFTGPTGTVSSTTATFQFSSGEGGATFQCRIDGGSYSPCTSPVTYNSLSQGPHTFNVRAVDQAGNTDSTPAERTWTIDSSFSISGSVKQAPAMTNLSGVTITLSGCANAVTTTDGSGNYSFAGVFSGTCTLTPSGLSKFYNTLSRTYTNVTGTITGADFTAYDTEAELPTQLSIVNPYVVAGQNAVVKVMLDTQVAVSSVAFSVDFDESMFVGGAPTVACGSDAGAGCGLTVVPGSVGVTVVPQSGTFAPGVREVATLTFQTQVTSSSNALMDLTNAPTALLVQNTSNDPLNVELVDGHIVYQQGFEGDLGGRPMGDGILFSNDVILARQFAVSAGTIANPAYNEFQRADVSPKATKGDGSIDSTDVIQARRYISGTDASTSAGGPFQLTLPEPPPANLGMVETGRVLRVASRTAVAGSKAIVPIEMKALGNELAVRFTLQYDAMKLSDPTVSVTGVAPADAVLTINDSESGRLTILIDSGTTFLSTDGPLVNVTFDVSATAATGESVISFANNGSISDALANPLPASYLSAPLNINGAGYPEVGISGRILAPSGMGVRIAKVTLIGPDGYIRTVLSSTLGYYSFDGVPAGLTYRIGVSSKQYRFESRLIDASADLSEVDFIGLE